MKRRLKRFGRGFLRFTALAAVLGLVAGVYLYDYPRVAADVPEAVLAYRDAGLPWTAKDIAPDPPVTVEENAASLLRESIDAWPHEVITDADGATRDVYFDKISEASFYGEPVAHLLPPVARSLAIAHRAAAKSRLDLGRDRDLGSSIALPEESRVRALAKALSERAVVRCEKGDDAGAIADLEDARRLGALIGSESSVISALVGVACERFALNKSLQCLALAAGDPLRLARYRAWLAKPRPLFDLHRALRGEIYLTIASTRNFDRMKIGTSWNFMRDQWAFACDIEEETDFSLDPATVRRDGYSDLQRPRAYLARALRHWTDLANSTNGLQASMDRIGEEAARIEVEANRGIPTLSGVFDTITFPVFSQFGRSNRRVQASRTLALLYADALLLHARRNVWPLSFLFPDPLGDGTFRTGVDADGRFRVWSVGENGVDDGGFDPSERLESSNASDDLAAAYPPLPKRPVKRAPSSSR